MLSPFTANQTLGRAWPFSKNQEQQQQQVGQFSSPFEQLIMNPFGNMGLSQSPASWSALRQLGIASLLSSDLIESPTDYHIVCELPGVPMSSVQVLVDPNTITIRANRSSNFDAADGSNTFHQRECVSGRVERSFPVPEDADESKAKASIEHGVLTVSLPKRPDGPQSQGNRRSLPISSDAGANAGSSSQAQGAGAASRAKRS